MKPIRELISAEYFPFGSQYYRAPSPDYDDWDADLRHFAGQGLNTVKFWVQWRWNNPAPDRYDWDDIDRLMDLAASNGLHVMLNTIVDVAPAWIYESYPNAVMLTRDGRRVGPQTQPHRQIGGLGLCLTHEQAIGWMMEFLAQTVQRYTQHPALEIWNVGSEPELTQSMSEMRLWANDHARIADMLDYNPHSISAFRRWLEKKYGGSLDELNRRWNRNYTSFDQVEAPLTRNTFNDVVDWRMFFVHVLGENVRQRFEVCRHYDEGRHPIMCHHVTIEGFPVTSTANDPWNVGQYGDLHGATQMLTPFMMDVLRSCAKDKPVVSAEQLGMLGYTLDVGEPLRPDDVKRLCFTAIAAGARGIVYWQYRPELLGREAPTWGLTTLDGKPTPWLEAFAQCAQTIAQEPGFWLDCERRPADVALLFTPENQVFQWAASGAERTATESLVNYHKALYEANLAVDFIHPREIRNGILSNYRAVILPAAYWMDRDIAEALRRWVAEGGFLMGEVFTAGWEVDRGRHQPVAPGYGLDEVFGARQGTVHPVENRDGARAWLRMGNVRAFGRHARAELAPLPGAEVLATWESDPFAGVRTDIPAVVWNRYGRGQAILAGSYLGLAFPMAATAQLAPSGFKQADAGALAEAAMSENRRLIRALFFRGMPAIERPSVEAAQVRIDVLRAPQRQAVIVQNLGKELVVGAVHVPGVSGRLEEVFGFGALDLDRAGKGLLDLPPGAVRVYMAAR
jgi:beta-galactosidase